MYTKIRPNAGARNSVKVSHVSGKKPLPGASYVVIRLESEEEGLRLQ